MKFTKELQEAMGQAGRYAFKHHHEYITPEHLLYGLLNQLPFQNAILACNEAANMDALFDELEKYILDNNEQVAEDEFDTCTGSFQMEQLILHAVMNMKYAEKGKVTIAMVVIGFFDLPDSWAAYFLHNIIGEDEGLFINEIIEQYEPVDGEDSDDDDDMPVSRVEIRSKEEMIEEHEPKKARNMGWKQLVTCINDHLADHNPLIGRKAELDRTIQVLCRKEKNNPLHIGEPGVGKTSIVYGLADLIERGMDVPERLKGCKIYQLDMGTLLAGSQFRGDMEQRVKNIMEGIIKEKNAILYIDEIHNIVGAGRGAEGGNDVSNMLKPYLDGGEVRFIGATTYEEYNRQLSKSKGMIRRFQTIDIEEPSVEETINILQQLKGGYEKFHKVKYDDEAIAYAVTMSKKFINDRFLPDKAIDLIDEAGAEAEAHGKKYKKITKKQIAEVLAKMAKVDSLAIKQNDNANLASLEKRMKAVVFGQDKAIASVVEAVQLSKAGLSDENKPLASLLFVGPTGVGKTEVAKTLAKELGVQLVRFDMSEYVEKHTVAKLIGSPAGYVGYEDGGLLTDAIRKNPDCVLLLDEIEKAHTDIFNILLQVMDYGVLTDSKGRKAYFQNVTLIMTSNAGAQFAAQASLGFASSATTGGAMLKQVKKTFKPEFINRLSDIVVFNDMDKAMADLILKKKLGELSEKLKAKNVTIKLDKNAHEHLLNEGFSKEYGAREMDRVIQQQLKTLLMREILYGKLKQGGKATIILNEAHSLQVKV